MIHSVYLTKSKLPPCHMPNHHAVNIMGLLIPVPVTDLTPSLLYTHYSRVHTAVPVFAKPVYSA